MRYARVDRMTMLTAVFDIGKTNKKFVVFDADLRPVTVSSTRLATTRDDDGDPCEDLDALTSWMRESLRDARRQAAGGVISRINFSTYGASLVHLGDRGRPVTPLYDYLKEYPPATLADFHARHGDPEEFDTQEFATETASPVWGMLNSGLQLFRLKHDRPDVFRRIECTLHLPQYCSYFFGGHAHDEATSLGCHTAMWDFCAADYHPWLAREGVARVIPTIRDARTTFASDFNDGRVEVGAGVHDSSAALVPYLMTNGEPFLFVSTGTWVVTMNPFSADPLTVDELRRGALCYLTPERGPVKSARLYLGAEFERMSARIAGVFGVDEGYCASLAFDEGALQAAREVGQRYTASTDLATGSDVTAADDAWDPVVFGSAAVASHALNDALVALQLGAVEVARGGTPIRTVFVDGGFSRNAIFLRLLARALDPVEVHVTELAQASAVGAALLVSGDIDRERVRELIEAKRVGR